ncbi:MAG: hypothetical protein EHM57_00780 [Actinobacteria bacterium]|nr:MAG: hypothetical protein EHM57_00780 [Actinomycetota bacterium]
MTLAVVAATVFATPAAAMTMGGSGDDNGAGDPARNRVMEQTQERVAPDDVVVGDQDRDRVREQTQDRVRDQECDRDQAADCRSGDPERATLRTRLQRCITWVEENTDLVPIAHLRYWWQLCQRVYGHLQPA